MNDNLKKQVDMGQSGLDVIHGELKNLMYMAEQELNTAQAHEDLTEEAMDSMERKYWEGMLDAYTHLYTLTYDLSFAIADRDST